MVINFLDTSAVLNGGLEIYSPCYISPITLMELENIKQCGDKEKEYKARQAIKKIINSFSIQVPTFSQFQIKRTLKKYKFLSEINDHLIICTAILLSKKNDIFFITSDGAQLLFAKEVGCLTPILLDEKLTHKEEYKGWTEYYPSYEQLNSLYSEPTKNVLGCRTNQFAKIYSEKELKDVLFWDGTKYQSLKYQSFKGSLGEKVAPRNLEQKMLFHLLQNDDIKIKLCLGGFGDGKTWTMLQHALKGIKEGKFSKIIFVRNNIVTKGSRDIGYLSGSLIEKIRPYLMPIADLTSEENLDEWIESGVIEPVPLAFMRGRDFSNDTLVFCDEAENLTKENVQLLIGRIGEGSQLWFAGDLKQIDHQIFEKNNGLRKMIDSLAGNELFGMVRLIKSERSKTSQLADLMD